MKNTHAFARIVVVGLGIYTCLRMVPLLLSSFFVLNAPNPSALGMGLLHLALIGILLGVVAYMLFYQSNALAARLACDLETMPACPIERWLPVVLRLICLGVGLLYLSAFVTGLSHAFQLWTQIQHHPGLQEGRIPFMKVKVLAWGLLLPLGIYLVCGAPHLVRWQVKRITGALPS